MKRMPASLADRDRAATGLKNSRATVQPNAIARRILAAGAR